MKHEDRKRLCRILAWRYPDASAQPNVFEERYRSAVEHQLHELSHAAVFGWKLRKTDVRLSSKVSQRFDNMESGLTSDLFEIRTLAVELLTLTGLGWELSPKRRQMLVGSAFGVARHFTEWPLWRARVVSAMRQPRNKALARRLVRHIRNLGF